MAAKIPGAGLVLYDGVGPTAQIYARWGMFSLPSGVSLPDMDNSRDLARFAGLAGIGGAILYLISLMMLSGLPTVADSGTEVASWYGEHRGAVLAAVVINGIAWLALLPLFATGLSRRLGDAAGAVVLAAAVVEAALIGAIVIFLATLAFRAPAVPPPTALALSDAAAFATHASAWPTVLLLAAALSAKRLPRVVAAFATLALLLEALAGFSVARDGLFSPTGAFALLAPICFALFMLAAGAWLLRDAAAGSEPL
jgi:hypothetical protein